MKGEIQRKPTEEQQRASSPTNSVWVSANAGSGKTQVLVQRVIKLLLDGAEPSTILCITFTKAAAAEMSQRLFARLSSWTSLNDQELLAAIAELGMPASPTMLTRARRLFTLALETPGGLKIQTIHGFCERLLQLFPVEAGLAPGFSVIDEFQAQEIRDNAIARLLLDQGPRPEVRKALDEAKSVIGEIEGFTELVIRFLRIISKNVAFRGGQLNRQKFEGALKILLNLDLMESAETLHDQATEINRTKYEYYGRLLQPFGSYGRQKTPSLLEAIAANDDNFDDLCRLFLTGTFEPFKRMISKDAEKKHPDAFLFLTEEQQRFHEKYCKYGTLLQIEASGAIYEIANVVRHDIEAQKQLSGLCDFDDLIDRAAALLTGKDATHWVLRKLDQGLNHILVDEAQDTSPAQWKIIRALADEFFAGQGREQKILRTMFVVGDRKQSIYSFQGADLRTFGQTREYLTSRLDQAGNKFAEEKLDLSFRSAKEILEAVDLVFPVKDLSHMGIRGEAISESPHTSARLSVGGIVELWPLIIGEKRDREDGEAWDAPVDQLGETHPRRLLAQKIAATLKNWIGRRNLSGESRPIAAGDILILLQRRTGLFPLLLAEMRRVGLPVAGADRLTLQNSLAVRDLMAFLQWCLLPQDDYSLACILKSPIVPKSISEEELFALAHDRGSSSLWEVLCPTSSPNVSLLTGFQAKATCTPVTEFLHQILNLARKRIVARLGSEALEATDALLDLAYDFESKHGGGVSAFLSWFEKSETILKREMEQASDQIRVMSVHAAKGLEANIVILPDAADLVTGSQQARLIETGEDSRFPSLPFWSLGGLASTDELARWIEDEKTQKQEERNRLLYVAMTRARNELYITGSTSKKSVPESSWWKRLELSLGPKFLKEPSLIETDDMSPNANSPGSPAVLPSWVFEPVATISQNPILFRTRDASLENEATRHGAALHLMMQNLCDIDPQTRPRVAFQWGSNLNLKPVEVENLLGLFDRADLTEFWSADGRSEVEIWSPEAKSQTQIYRIDRLVLGPTETLILDYKSGASPKLELTSDDPYLIQMAQYYRAIKAIRPEKPIRCAILWLESGALDWFSESQLSQPTTTLQPQM